MGLISCVRLCHSRYCFAGGGVRIDNDTAYAGLGQILGRIVIDPWAAPVSYSDSDSFPLTHAPQPSHEPRRISRSSRLTAVHLIPSLERLFPVSGMRTPAHALQQVQQTPSGRTLCNRPHLS